MDDHCVTLRTGTIRQHHVVMRTSRHQNLRRHIAARYAELELTQDELAHKAGTSRGSVLRLMKGDKLLETTEAKIERALGWRLGSVQEIRDGGEPTLNSAADDQPDYEELAKLDVVDAIKRLGVNERDAAIVLGVIEQVREQGGSQPATDSDRTVTRRRRQP